MAIFIDDMADLVVGHKYRVHGFEYWLHALHIETHRCGKQTVDLTLRNSRSELRLQTVGNPEVEVNFTLEGYDILKRLPMEKIE